MTDPQTDPVGFDDDEDLFAFDNLTAEASRKLSAELEAELDNALEEIEGDLDLARESSPNQGAEGAAAPALPAAASAPATPAAPAASPAPESSQGAPSPLSARVPELGALPPLPRRSPARRSYLTLHRTQLLLGLMVVINFLLAGLSWRAEDTERQMPVIADTQGVFAPLGDDGRQTRVASNRDLPISAPRARCCSRCSRSSTGSTTPLATTSRPERRT